MMNNMLRMTLKIAYYYTQLQLLNVNQYVAQ